MSYEFAHGFKIRNQSLPHFLTFTAVEWTDLFTRKVYRDLLLTNMNYCRKHKALRVGAYVIMSNHLHVIWRSEKGRLSDVIRDFKSYCTKQLIESIKTENESRRDGLLRTFRYHAGHTNQNKEYKIWRGDNHPEEITSQEFMLSKLAYIHQNPVRAGWVRKPEDWLYSSASNYAGKEALMEVDFLY